MDKIDQNMPSDPIVEPKKSHFREIILGIALIIVAGLALGAYLMFHHSADQTLVQDQSITQPSANQTDQTANWKTHLQEVNLYSIKYPEGWVAQDIPGDSCSATEFMANEVNVVSINFGSQACVLVSPKQVIDQTAAMLDGVAAVRQTIIDDKGKKIIRVQTAQPRQGITYRIDLEDRNSLSTYNAMLATFKFTDKSTNEDGLKTYTNNSLGFSIQYPSDVKPSMELNDQVNRLTAFGDISGKYFEVRLYKDNDANIGIKYGFLDADVTSQNVKIGGTTGYKAVSPTGYGDGGAQGVPYVEYGVRHNGNVYHIIFYGDATVSAEESQILSTFKFTN